MAKMQDNSVPCVRTGQSLPRYAPSHDVVLLNLPTVTDLGMHLTHNSLFSMLVGSLRETLGHNSSYKSDVKPEALGPSILNLSCNTFRKTQIPSSTKST